uniref:Uncharacterized protein n=1 Tax=Prymnesium polylepis TaxID=72548 RepID=A0A7S4IZ43_9EUKA
MPPDGPDDDDAAPSDLVEQQVNSFVPDYLELLRIRLSQVPRLSDGRRPHECVADKPIMTAACCDFLNMPTVPEARRASDLMRQDEQQRDAAMRNEGSLPLVFAMLLTSVYALLLGFVCVQPLQIFLSKLARALRRDEAERTWIFWLALLLGILLAGWMHTMIISLARSYRCFQLAPSGTCVEGTRRAGLAIYEFVGRYLGWPTPLEMAQRPLEERCQSTMHLWLGRLARRRFYDAIHRRRIGVHEAVALLEDLSNARDAKIREVANSSSRWLRGFDAATRRRKKKARERRRRAQVRRAQREHDEGDYAPPRPLPSSTHGGRRPTEGELELEEEEEAEDDEARLPGSLEQAEAFLSLEVHTDEPEDASSSVLWEAFDNAMPLPPMATDPAPVDSNYRLKDFSERARGDRSSTSVETVLKERGWKFVRKKKHIVYQRLIANGKRQVFTASATASDWRASRNQLAVLERFEDIADEMYHQAPRPRSQGNTSGANAGRSVLTNAPRDAGNAGNASGKRKGGKAKGHKLKRK